MKSVYKNYAFCCGCLLLAAIVHPASAHAAEPAPPVVTGPAVAASPWWAWTSSGGTGEFRISVDDPTMANASTTRNTQLPAPSHLYFNGAFGGATTNAYTNYIGTSTVGAWVLAESTDGVRPIFSFAGGYLLFCVKDGRLSLVGTGWEALTADPVIPVNKWVYVAFTHDPLYGIIELFVNSAKVATLEINSYPNLNHAAQLGSNVARTAFWHGGIARLRVWTRLLSQEELRQAMTYSVVPGGEDVHAFWPLNHVSGNVAYDLGPNTVDFDLGIYSQTAEWRGSTFLPPALGEGPHTLYVQERDAEGNWSPAGSFTVIIDTTPPASPAVSCAFSEAEGWEWQWAPAGDGVELYRYSLDDSEMLEFAEETEDVAAAFSGPPYLELTGNNALYAQSVSTPGDLTFETWAKPASIDGRQTLLSTWGPDGRCAIVVDDGHPQVKDLGGNLLTAGSVVLPVDEWTHLAFSYSRQSKTGRIFVNGEPVAEGTLATGFHASWWFSYIGCDNLATNYFDYWQGGLREMRVWSGALDKLQLSRYMWTAVSNAAPNLLARYPLDDMSGSAPAGYPADLVVLFPYYNLAWHGINAGNHTLYVQERDEAGNWSQPGECTLSVDREGPTPPQFSVPFPQSNDMTFTWTWTDTPGGTGLFWVRCDGGAWVSVGNATNWTPGQNLALGYHTLEVYEVDEFGNRSEVVHYVVYLDPDLVPLHIITGQHLYGSFSQEFSVPLEVEGGQEPYTWSIVPFAPYSAETLEEPIWIGGGELLDITGGYAVVEFPWPIRFFDATIDSAYVDNSGIISTPYGSIEVIGLAISFPNEGDGIFFTPGDEYMAFRWKGTCDTTLEPLHMEVLLYRDGRIVCSSAGATVNSYGNSLEWFADSTVIPGTFDGELLPGATSVQFTRRAGLSALGLSLSNDGVLSGTPLEPGTFEIVAGVHDAASYPLNQFRGRTFIIHIDMPAPTLQEEPEWTAGTENSIAWTGPGESYFLECSTDASFATVAASSGWAAGAAFEFDDLQDGVHYYYRAKSRVDFSSVESAWSNIVSSAQDNTPPTGAIAINSGAQFTNDTGINVVITANDTGAGVDDMSYSLDGADWSDWQACLNLKQFALTGEDGQKTVAFKFRDAVGNVSQEVGGQIILDREPPQILLLGESELNVQLGTRYADAGATAHDAIEGDLTARLEMNTNLNAAALGAYTVAYSVTDTAGNIAAVVTRVLHVVDLYMSMVTDGATIYLGSSAGPIPLVVSFNAPVGTQSVVLSESVLSEAMTLPAPNGQLTLLLDPETIEFGEHTLQLVAVLNDLTEVPVGITFTLAPLPPNSDTDANGIPDNPFSVLSHGDLWLDLTYVADAQARRLTAVKRVDADAAAGRVKADVAMSNLFDATVSVSAPAGALNANEAGVLIVSTAPSLPALLGEAAAGLPAAPPQYALAQGGVYALVSFIASADGLTYRAMDADELALDPVIIAADLPAAPTASAALFAFPAEILSDDAGLYAAPAGDAWTTDTITGLVRNNAGLTANLAALSIIAPFVDPAADDPAVGCLGSKTTSTRATADLAPITIMALFLLLGRRTYRKR